MKRNVCRSSYLTSAPLNETDPDDWESSSSSFSSSSFWQQNNNHQLMSLVMFVSRRKEVWRCGPPVDHLDRLLQM